MTENLDRLPACFKVPQLSLHPMHEFSLSSTENQPSASTRHLIFFCSVRSPSLTNMADSSRRVELADLDWLFFIPSNQRTNSLMACTWWEQREYLKNWTRSLQSVFIIKMMWSINFLILHFNGRRDWESEAGGGCLRCILYLLLPRPQVRLPHLWSRASHSCFRPTGDIFKKNTSNKLSNIHSLFQDFSQRSIYPVIHEEILYDEVCHNGLHRWRKLVWGKHGDVAQRHEGSDELLWDVCIQTTGQRLRAETNKVYIQI